MELVLSLSTKPKFTEMQMITMLKALGEPLSIGNWEGAREALAIIERKCLAESVAESITLDSHPQVLPLREYLEADGFEDPTSNSLVIVNLLERQGILTLKELTVRTEEDLMRMANMGMRRARCVALAMQQIGLSLAPER